MSNLTLNEKRILLFIPKFFAYDKAIKEQCIKLGADVSLYDERAVTSAFARAVMKIFPFLFGHKANSYYKRIIDNHKDESVDYILIIRGDMVSEKTLKRLKKVFPHAKLCLHLWDSLVNIKGITKRLKYFDYITSFDRNDCQKHTDFRFRPLFCMDEYNKEAVDTRSVEAVENVDIFFCGTIHSDRYKVIKAVESQCERLGFIYKGIHYLQSKFMYSFYKIFKREFIGAKKADFCFVPMPTETLSDAVERSKAILDIQHPKQSGLTMRTIEMLGMKKKIITTNKDIKNYDFYDPDNITVIDRSSPVIDAEIFNTPFMSIPSDVWSKYSLAQWIYDVLGAEVEEWHHA